MAVFTTTSYAQLLTGKSAAVTREARTTKWVLRAGLAIDSYYGKDLPSTSGSKVGYDFNIGFNKPIGSRGAYWGMDFGFLTRGYKKTDVYSINKGQYTTVLTQNFTRHAFAYSPFNFGWKIPVGKIVALDPHVGINMSVDFAGSNNFNDKDFTPTRKWDEGINRFDLATHFGFGVWFLDRFNVDLRYRVGFFPDDDDWEAKLYSEKFVFSLGVAF